MTPEKNNTHTKGSDDVRASADTGSPLVSIIIPAYKVTAYIAETLDSALAQSYQNYEIILVNDGCPDTEELEKVLAPYRDRITYIEQPNGGAAAARNTAIRAASGEFLAFLDGDDIWKTDYLSVQIEQAIKQDCDAIYCDAELFGGNVGNGRTYMEFNPAFGEVSSVSLIRMVCNPITSGMVARHSAVLEVGLFDATLPNIGFEDFDLWFRIARSGYRIGYHKNVLLRYRVRPNSLSGGPVRQAERTLIVWETLRSKYDLTPVEEASLKESIKVAENRLAIERFREALLLGKIDMAGQQVSKVSGFFARLKLRVIWLIALLSPALFRFAYRSFRPREYDFVVKGYAR